MKCYHTPEQCPLISPYIWQALQDLENSASSDAVVREKIARLPPEVSETSHLDKINSTDEGLKLLAQVMLILKIYLSILLLYKILPSYLCARPAAI